MMTLTLMLCVLLLFAIPVNCQSFCPNISGLTGTVPNSSFTASGVRDNDRLPQAARISNDTRSWCSQQLNDIYSSPWVQVDLGGECLVHSVSVGGDEFLFNEFIVNYFVLYKTDINSSLQFIIDPQTNNAKVFPRLRDSSVQTRELPIPVLARVIRIMALPGSWNSDHVCLRFEVNGCADTSIQGTTSTSSLSPSSSSPSFSSSNVSPSPTISSSSTSSTTERGAIHTTSYCSCTTPYSSFTSSYSSITTSSFAKTSSVSETTINSSPNSNNALTSTSVIIITRYTFSSSSSRLSPSANITSTNSPTAVNGTNDLLMLAAASVGAFGGIILCACVLLFVCCLFFLCWKIKNRRKKNKKLPAEEPSRYESLNIEYSRLRRDGSSASSNINSSLTISQRSMELSNASNNSVTTFDEIPEVYDYVMASTIHPVVPEEEMKHERPAPPAETRVQHKVPTRVPIQPQVPVKKPKVPLKPKGAGKVFVNAKIPPVEEEYDVPIRRANELQHYKNNEGLIYNLTYGAQI